MAGLRLEVRDFTDLTRWRWVLLDEATDAFLADHEVRLNPDDWQFQAFGDLTGYLSSHVAPDRWGEGEARIVGQVGTWIGSEVLGPIAGALARKRPAAVRVVVPEAAEALLFRPLELAHAGGRPLSVQDVTLVMEAKREESDVRPVGERLRVLGLFSLPEGGRPLNLRRERHSLVRLIQEIAATGKAADVRVLQYGVIRERLRDVLEEAEGWDIIHVSGHGTPGELLLETADGKPDPVNAADLADMLGLARERLKLVTVSACWSAAITANEQRRLLGLPVHDLYPERSADPPLPPAASGTLAVELAARLECAVLAMRYPVTDDFAIALSDELYKLLVEMGRPLPRALGMALRTLTDGANAAGSASDGIAGPPPGATGQAGTKASGSATDGTRHQTRYPALSVATPALFGSRAVGLTLAAPERHGTDNYDTAYPKMCGFPPQPDRFVGRTVVMARVSAALAQRSGIPGVLFHGMPGGGKTACALELAYTHEHAFDRLVWYKNPDEGFDITGSLTDFALTLERYLDGFQMAHACVSAETLTAFLPKLTELMERKRLLIVIDNGESLLTDIDAWRDGNWAMVVDALTSHSGPGRLILTSRRVPKGLARLRMEAVDALSPDEALLLAREFPNLSALKLGKVPGIGRTVSRQLARNAIAMAQGHPKLLELAEGQAANPDHLLKLIKTGDQAWRQLGKVPDGFFTASESITSGDGYFQVLAAWTKTVTDTLTPGERDLFWFLCCLEEPDREHRIISDNFRYVLGRLGRDGDLPDLPEALTAISARGLGTIREPIAGKDELHIIHPGVANAGRVQAGTAFRDAVDNEAAAYWETEFAYASGQAGDGEINTDRMVHAALSVAPYMMRLENWEGASYMIDTAFARDPSRSNAATAYPLMQQITEHDPRQIDNLAKILRAIDPIAARAKISDHLETAAASGDYRAASSYAGWLINRLLEDGRLADALALSDQKIRYARQAGLGQWSQLGGEVQRLQVLNEMGKGDQVFEAFQRLMEHARTLPDEHSEDEMVQPWNIREALLACGRYAAVQLGMWAKALELNTEIISHMNERHALAGEVAATRLNDCYSLLQLDRIDDALSILREARQTFEDAHDVRMLAHVLSAMADTENHRSHWDVAAQLECDALRYGYNSKDVIAVEESYRNLGDYLNRQARQPSLALACHLASAIICTLTNRRDRLESIRDVVSDLREFNTSAFLPPTISGLYGRLSHIPGTDLPSLLEKLAPDPETTEQTLRDLIAQAQQLAAAPEDGS